MRKEAVALITGYYEDLEVGTSSESRGRTITETDIVSFAGLAGDFHPLHTDAEYAANGQFGERIAHGLLTLAVASGLMTLSHQSVRAFYGMDTVRFLRPVRIGDTIRVRSDIAEIDPPKDGAGKVSLNINIVNQRDEPVLAMQMMFVVGTRPA